jgi:hypothetical protein
MNAPERTLYASPGFVMNRLSEAAERLARSRDDSAHMGDLIPDVNRFRKCSNFAAEIESPVISTTPTR